MTIEQIAAIHAEARKSFIPVDNRHEYIQLFSVILQYRDGYPPRKGSIGRKVCRDAIKRARELRANLVGSES